MTFVKSFAISLMLASANGTSTLQASPRATAASSPEACAQVGPRKYSSLPSGSFYNDNPAERCAIEGAVANGLLGSGYFRMVDDKSEASRALTAMKERLHKLGISATFGRCDWVGLVSDGTAHGNNSYGAACKLTVDRHVPRWFLICNSQYGGVTLAQPDVFAADRNFIETFIRRACL